jgi:esterase/lipase superfamily enzyme
MPLENYVKWFSPRLNRDMELLVYGDRGAPVLVFPTSGARFFEWKDFLMVDALADKIDAGYIQLFCAESVSLESWYNDHVHPRYRVVRHDQWEAYLKDELIPFIRACNSNGYLTTVGTSFGAYLAVNFAFKNPDLIHKTVGLSGAYSVKRLLDGYYDQDCYFNCPVAYMPNLSDDRVLGAIRNMEIRLVTSDWDVGICRESTYQMSKILDGKSIGHRLDDWGGGTGHDWPYWRKMIRTYL